MIIPDIIYEVVKMMNNYLKDTIKVEIIDTEMSRKHVDNNAPNGYMGVSIIVSCNKKKYRVFLKYQQAEDIYFNTLMLDGFFAPIVREDLIKIIKNHERKEKLKKLNGKQRN